MEREFGDRSIYINWMEQIKNRFNSLVDTFEARLEEKLRENIASLISELDTIRDENVARESEQDPEFRDRITQAIMNAENLLAGFNI
jgi:hypothetical protein